MSTEYNNEKEIQKVVQGQVSVRKKGFLTKVKEAFIAADVKTAASTVADRTIVPMIKRTLADAVNNAVNVLLFGTALDPNNRWGSGTVFGGLANTFRYSGQNINYSGISKPAPIQQSDIPTYNEIVLADRIDAERVLDELSDIIDRYGSASIADLYQAVGLPTVTTQYNYGWRSMKGADAVAVREGYLLKLPNAIPLK